jgi:hypothetical protein
MVRASLGWPRWLIVLALAAIASRAFAHSQQGVAIGAMVGVPYHAPA